MLPTVQWYISSILSRWENKITKIIQNNKIILILHFFLVHCTLVLVLVFIPPGHPGQHCRFSQPSQLNTWAHQLDAHRWWCKSCFFR